MQLGDAEFNKKKYETGFITFKTKSVRADRGIIGVWRLAVTCNSTVAISGWP
jgi:hypothetical protein